MALTALLAGALGALTVWQPVAAAAAPLVLLLGGLLWSLQSRPGASTLGGKRFRWVSLAWIVVLLLPAHSFSSGSSPLAAAEGNVSLESFAELLAHAVIGLVALVSLRVNRLDVRPDLPLLALPLVAVLSTFWSIVPAYTLARALELLTIVLLATLTGAIVRSSSDGGAALVRSILRRFVQVTVLLCLAGLALGDGGLSSGQALVRFTWPGAHPVVAAAVIGVALLCVLFGDRADTGFRPVVRVGCVGLFGACLYLGETRTALAGLAVSILVGYWLSSKRRRVRRLLGGLSIAASVYLALAVVGDRIWRYLSRDQSAEQLSSLNGRTGIWEAAIERLDTPERLLVGYGLGSPRSLLYSSFSWGGSAHSAWVELLVALGLLGLTAGLIVVATLGVRLWAARNGSRLDRVIMPVLFTFVLAMSPAADGFGAPGPGPGLGFGIVALGYAVVSRRARAVQRSPAGGFGRPLRQPARPVPV